MQKLRGTAGFGGPKELLCTSWATNRKTEATSVMAQERKRAKQLLALTGLMSGQPRQLDQNRRQVNGEKLIASSGRRGRTRWICAASLRWSTKWRGSVVVDRGVAGKWLRWTAELGEDVVSPSDVAGLGLAAATARKSSCRRDGFVGARTRSGEELRSTDGEKEATWSCGFDWMSSFTFTEDAGGDGMIRSAEWNLQWAARSSSAAYGGVARNGKIERAVRLR